MKKLFLLDMDGTIYLGEQLFEGTADFLSWIRKNGGQYAFLTNNSSKGIEDYLAKMQRMGIPQTPENFLTSTDATIDYLKKTYPPFAKDRSDNKNCRREITECTGYPFTKNESDVPESEYYVCGTESLKRQLRAEGLRVLTDEELDETLRLAFPLQDGTASHHAPSLPVLIIGFDTELTFKKLENSVRLLNLGADYIATHPDLVCPVEYGCVPDAGLIIHALKVCTGREPVVIGKPRPQMVYTALEKYGASPKDTILIGDRLYTDIACGNNAGIDTVLVLSGEGTEEDCEKYGVHPKYIYQNIAAVLKALKSGEL